MPDGWRLTVRQGGAVSDPTVDYTAQVLAFEEGDLGTAAFEAAASFGQGTQWTVVLDDDVAEIPKADLTKSLAGHNQVILSETVGGTEYVLAYGRFASKDWSANESYPRRQAKITLDDINAEVKGLALRAPWVRSAETGRARVLAALAAFCNGSPRLTTVIDDELVAAGDEVAMPAKTYPAGTDLAEIFDDCASVEGKVWGVVIHHTGGSHKCFLYKLPTDHTTYASTVVINSDSVGDLDEDDTTAPVVPAIWGQGQATREDPQELANVIVSTYGTGDGQYTLAEDTANQASYDYWAKPFNDPIAVTAAQAATRAAAMLTISKNEHLTHTPSILLKREQIHLLCAGMSITFRSSAMMGGQYLDTDQTRTVASVRWVPEAGPAGAPARYRADLELDRPLRLLPATGNLPPAVKPPTEGTSPSETLYEFLTWDAGQEEWDHPYSISGTGTVLAQSAYYGGAAGTSYGGTFGSVGEPTPRLDVTAGWVLHVSAFSQGFGESWPVTDHGRVNWSWGVKFYDVSDNLLQIATIGSFENYPQDGGWQFSETDALTVPTGAVYLRLAAQTDAGLTGYTNATHLDQLSIYIVSGAGTSGTTAPSLGGPGEGSFGTPGTYLPADAVIEHGDLSGKGGIMHDANQIGITDAGGIFAGTTVEAALQEGKNFDPRYYGAAADATTDDTTAIQAAIVAAEVGGGVVDGGGKTYAITDTLEFTANSRVEFHNLTLKFGSGVTAVKVAQGAGGGTHGVLFDSVYWWSTSTTGTIGLYLEDTDRVTVRNSRIDACAYGIDFHPSSDWVEGTALEDVWVTGCTTGIRFLGSGGTGSFMETSFRNVGVNDCDVGIDITQDALMYRSDWVNVTVWPSDGGTAGVRIDGDMEGFRGSIGFDGGAGGLGSTQTSWSIGANAVNLDKAEIWTQFAMTGITHTAVTGAGAGKFVYKIGAQTYSTGAAQGGRFVGATTSGAPASGTYVTGDYAVAEDGSLYICTAGGTPGTWTAAGGTSDLRWEAVTNGEDVFVWEGDDLVHEWKAY